MDKSGQDDNLIIDFNVSCPGAIGNALTFPVGEGLGFDSRH